MSRRDDINKLYQPSKTLEKVCYALFTADIAISLIAACVGGSVISYLTVALVIIAFLYMAISIIDDGIMWFQAESARRKNSIQVAYDVRLDEYETEKYYNNNVGDPDISYATNLFESAFFTKEISRKMLIGAVAKLLIAVVVLIITSPRYRGSRKSGWGLSQILCNHREVVKNRVKILKGGSGISCCRLVYKITAVNGHVKGGGVSLHSS